MDEPSVKNKNALNGKVELEAPEETLPLHFGPNDIPRWYEIIPLALQVIFSTVNTFPGF